MHENLALVIAGVLLAGVFCQWLAWRLKLPAILPLLLTGLALGPLLGWEQPQAVLGDLYFPVISLSVAIILFEGSLTLTWRDVRTVAGTVRNLLVIGAAVSWLGGALGARFILGLPWDLSFLFGALIIVTGPTVIAPLLRNVRPTRNVGSILKWEGILIDPIGATVAVLVFELIVAGSEPTWSGMLLSFLWIIGIGTAIGVAGGLIVYHAVHRYWLPDYLRDIGVLALVLAIFALSNSLAHESGLMAVTATGIFLANTDLKQLREVLYFKEKLSVLLISTLFVLLAANVTGEDLALLDWRSLLLLAVVILVLRPVGVGLCTLRSSLSRNERLFLAWIAPRGIVAASVSSLFAYALVEAGNREAAILAPLTFLVIVGTVLLQGLTAKPLAERLGVREADPQGFLIVGADCLGREIAAALRRVGVVTRLIDTNYANVVQARLQGLDAIHGNILSEFVETDIDLSGLGRLLALTENDEANALACRHFADEFGSANVYQLQPGVEQSAGGPLHPSQLGRLLFAPGATHARLRQFLDGGAAIRATSLTEKYGWNEYLREKATSTLTLAAVRQARVTLDAVGFPLKPRRGDIVLALANGTSPGRNMPQVELLATPATVTNGKG
jgi:NhaP-type Na+/H+ or K+/H+ antiporter